MAQMNLDGDLVNKKWETISSADMFKLSFQRPCCFNILCLWMNDSSLSGVPLSCYSTKCNRKGSKTTFCYYAKKRRIWVTPVYLKCLNQVCLFFKKLLFMTVEWVFVLELVMIGKWPVSKANNKPVNEMAFQVIWKQSKQGFKMTT